MQKLMPLVFVLNCLFSSVFGGELDSLRGKLSTAKDPKDKIELYNLLSAAIKDNSDSSIYYAQKAVDLSKEINHPTLIINSYLSLSNANEVKGNFDKCINYLFQARDIADSLNNKDLLGKIYNNLGNSYRHFEDINRAEEFYIRAIELYELTGNEHELGKIYNNVGLIYVRQEKLDLAIENYKQSVEIVRKYDDKTAIANGLSNLGVAYYYKGEIDKTIHYFEESLKIEKELGNTLGVAISKSNIGELYLETGDYQMAIQNLKSSIEISKTIEAQDLLRHTYQIISTTYAKLNNFEKAYQFHQLFVSLKDSINDLEKSKHAIALESKFKNAEKEKKILELENKQTLHELELNEKKYTQNILIGGVLIGLLVILLIYIRYRSSVKTKESALKYSKEIEQKNLEITDSITYAKRIQEAILPSEDFIKKALPDSFVFYKPKDIVAGDFYWVESLASSNDGLVPESSKSIDEVTIGETSQSEQEENLVLFAVADCTGHGVPGAMISVVCHNAINRVIREYKLLEPGKILDRTRELIAEQLNKSQKTHFGVRDGMDISLCSVQYHNNSATLNYAGANNPLWIVRSNHHSAPDAESPNSNEITDRASNDAYNLIEIKATKQHIGKVDSPIPFQNHSINLNKGDVVYLFSDGYADQFGGVKGKKLKSANFKKLLLSIQNESMDKQKSTLEQAFENWKGELDQLDDVCIFGIRI